MKAIECTKYGNKNNLSIVEKEIPLPKDDELLIKVHFSSVTTGDWRVKSLNVPRGFKLITRLYFGFFAPRQPVLGTEFSGTVVKRGKEVNRFEIGDEVMAMTGAKMGGHSQYLCISENDNVFKVPKGVPLELAAICSFGGVTAYDFLVNRAHVEKNSEVLVIGASGAVGSMAIQIAKAKKAKVYAVCSEINFDLVKKWGAIETVSYRDDEHLKLDKKFDIIFDCFGGLSYLDLKHLLKNKGILVLISGGFFDLISAPVFSLFTNHKILAGPASEEKKDYEDVIELMNSGQIVPLIDQVFSYQSIEEAYQYIGKRNKKGSVALKMLD